MARKSANLQFQLQSNLNLLLLLFFDRWGRRLPQILPWINSFGKRRILGNNNTQFVL